MSRLFAAIVVVLCVVVVHARPRGEILQELEEAARVFDELSVLLQVEERQELRTTAPEKPPLPRAPSPVASALAPRASSSGTFRPLPTIPEKQTLYDAAPAPIPAPTDNTVPISSPLYVKMESDDATVQSVQAVAQVAPAPPGKPELPTYTVKSKLPGCDWPALALDKVKARHQNLKWLEVKTHGPRELQEEYYELRNFYVPCMLVLSLIQAKCEFCKAQSVGTVSVTSDADYTIQGAQAAAVVEIFNTEFGKIWKRTSADVFDTNMYGIGWLDDKKVWQVLDSKGEPKESLPPCVEPVAKVPEGNISPVVTKDDVEADGKNQHTFAMAKVRYFARQAFAALYKDQEFLRGACDTAYDDPTLKPAEHCIGLVVWQGGLLRYVANRASEIDTLEVWVKAKKLLLDTWKESTVLLKDLLTKPCTDAAMKKYCVTVKGKEIIDMDNIEGRNLIYGEKLKHIYQFLNTRVGTLVQAFGASGKNLRRASVVQFPGPGQCLQLKKDISEAMFYGIETYWTKGTFLDVVVRQQMSVYEPDYGKIELTFSEYFDSYLENTADLMKVLVEGAHHKWDKVYTTIESSKYAFRMLMAAWTLLSDPTLAKAAPATTDRTVLPTAAQAERLKAAAVASRSPASSTASTPVSSPAVSPSSTPPSSPRAAPTKAQQDHIDELLDAGDWVLNPSAPPFKSKALNPKAAPFWPKGMNPDIKIPIEAGFAATDLGKKPLNPKAAPFYPKGLNPHAPEFVPENSAPFTNDGLEHLRSAFVLAHDDVLQSIECLKRVANDIKSQLRGKKETEQVKQKREKLLDEIQLCYKASLKAYFLKNYDSSDASEAQLVKRVMMEEHRLPLTLALNILHQVIPFYYKNHFLGNTLRVAERTTDIAFDVFDVLRNVHPKPNAAGRHSTGPTLVSSMQPPLLRTSGSGGLPVAKASSSATASSPVTAASPPASSLSVPSAASVPQTSARRGAALPPAVARPPAPKS